MMLRTLSARLRSKRELCVPRKYGNRSFDAVAAALEVLEASYAKNFRRLICKSQMSKARTFHENVEHTIRAEEVVKRDTEDVDSRGERLSAPIPTV